MNTDKQMKVDHAASLDGIEARLAAAEAARQAYQEMLDISTDGLMVLDEDWRFTYINLRAAHNVGREPADLVGKNIWEAFPTLADSPLGEKYRQAMQSRQPAHFEMQGAVTPGWYDIHINPSPHGITLYWLDITQRKEADARLQAAHAQAQWLARMPEQNPNPVLRVTEEGSILYHNTAARMLGWKSEIGGRLPEVVEPLLAQAIAQKERVLEHEVEIGERMFSVSIVPFPSERYANIYSRDITRRRVKEDELRRLNRVLGALGKSSQAMLRAEDETAYLQQVCRIITEDCGHTMVWIGFAQNDAEKSVTPVAYAGMDAGYLETLHITWADAPRGRGPTGTAIRTGKVAQCRNMLTDPCIEPWREEALKRGYRSSLVLPIWGKGSTIGAVTIYADQPEAFSEAEIGLLSELADDLAYGIQTLRLRLGRAEAEAALRASEERFRTSVESLVDGFTIFSAVRQGEEAASPGQVLDFRFEFINEIGARLYGGTIESLVGHTLLELGPVRPENFEYRLKVVETGEPVKFEDIYYETRDDGKQVVRLAHEVSAFRLGDGLVETRHDITESKSLEYALEEANASLERRVKERTEALEESEGRLRVALRDEQALRAQLIQSEKYAALARLVASVAHELNNPIQTIQNCMYLLKDEAGPNSSLTEIIDMADSESRRIARLVAQLKETYRPARSNAPELFNLVELLTQVKDILEPHLLQNHSSLAIEGALQNIPVKGITDQIKQVFLNICLNAIDAMQPQGGSITARLSVDAEAKMASVAFSDKGPGIPAENLEKLFEPFFTTKPKGTGLGLSICYEIVQGHGGKLEVESKLGEGATFTVWLPLGR